MLRLRNALLLLTIVACVLSCQKEISTEQEAPAVGSLQSNSGDCLPQTVGGTYVAAKALTDSNFIEVSVDVTRTGAYTIATDTLNGYWFRATGVFTSTGTKTVRLAGKGTPLAANTDDFFVQWDTLSTACYVSVQVQPAGTPSGPATFTLQGSPGACGSFAPAGFYVKDSTLNATNTVTVGVNVTAPGTYAITTNTVNGYSFSGTGTFTTTGAQTVVLRGTGKPLAAGTNNFTVTAGTATCSFSITCTATAPPQSTDYFPRTPNNNWSYELDNDPTDTLFQQVVAATHTVAGNVFNIFLETLDANGGYDSSGYFRRSGGNYIEFLDLGAYYGIPGTAVWTEMIFLKDDQAKGHIWNSPQVTFTGGGTSATVRERFEIMEKNITVTVNGVAFPNVIVVERRTEQLVGTTWQDMTSVVGYSKDYYARGVGRVKLEIFDEQSTLDVLLEIQRYLVQ